jgi:CRP/FNR family transcriptional regulator, cyclic AMP receptor protein
MERTELNDVDLGGLTLFADLTPSEIEAVYQAFEEDHAEPKTRLMREGFVGSGFHIILSGEAAWFVSGKRAERAATMIGSLPKPVTLRRGDWFGELSVLFNEPSIADVVALTPIRYMVIPAEELEPFLFRFPKVMFRLLQGEARRLRDPERWR